VRENKRKQERDLEERKKKGMGPNGKRGGGVKWGGGIGCYMIRGCSLKIPERRERGTNLTGEKWGPID